MGLTRNNSTEILEQCEKLENLVILHSAYNARRYMDGFKGILFDDIDYSNYLDDNVFLTMELLTLPHTRFIYFSSVDIYGPITPYSFLKRCVSELIGKMAPNHLVLNLPAILGPTMRKNSLLRVLEDQSTFWSSSASYNYILQSDVLKAILDEDISSLRGTYDFVASTNVTLGEVATHYKKEVNFGDILYHTYLERMEVSNNIHPAKDRTSWDTIKLFLGET